MYKFFIILLIFCGEVGMIYAQIFGARENSITSHSGIGWIWKVFLIATAGIWLTLTGYILGLKTFKNIWIVTAISIISILIMEPIMTYAITHQTPTRGALIGFTLGTLGLIATLVL